MSVKIVKLDPRARLPEYRTKGAAGADLRACLTAPMYLQPGRLVEIPTGLALEIPPGYEAQVRPRSGMVARFGATVANAPGTIDSDYRGEIVVLLTMLAGAAEELEINDGDRIAQLVFAEVSRADFDVVEDLTDTKRGAGGFGSTGMR